MKNNWHEIWNNRKSQIDEIDKNDEKKLIIELKRIIGADFFGKGSTIKFEEFQKTYIYLRDNLKTGGGATTLSLRWVAAAAQIFTFSTKTALKLVV